MGQQGFTTADLMAAIQAGNADFLQWYAITHQTTIPVNPNTPIYTGTFGAGTLSIPSNTFALLAIAAVALILLAK